ncbi:MAG: outer membrane beta-barrel protein [Muribaculaceae bacterium]|nr:outer membrane beta-barrel protein [Muribaculaceae bacterium]
MKKFLILFVFLSFFVNLNAIIVTGKIFSISNSKGLSNVQCDLLCNDNIISSIKTGTKGEFSFIINFKDNFVLKFSSNEYNTSEIYIENKSKNINLGKIYLSKSHNLNEIIINGNLIHLSNGNILIYPSKSDINTSTNAISLFQKLPLAGLESNPVRQTLTVDAGSPMILINGIPSTMEDLQGLLAKDIKKIEFSRVTPARYADQGYSGFLNITLKERTDGGTVYLWGRSALNTAFMDGNFNFSYHQGPSQITIGYSPSWRNYHDVFDNTWESLIAPDFKVELDDHDNNPFNYHYHNLLFKYDFFPNTRTLFSATLRARPNFNNSKSYGDVIDSELGEYSYINKTKNDGFNPSLDLFFRHDFNDNNSLEIEEVGTINHSKYRYNSIYDFGNYNEDYTMDANSNRSSLISEISYVHNFNDKSSLSTGYQNTYSYSKNKYLSSDYTPILKENNNYVYAKYGQTIGKVYFSLSTGVKLFWIENDLNKRHFIKNLSSFYISWNISKFWNITGNFSYNPGIPSLTSLTEYPQQKTPYLIINGNPDLKVSETMRYQIMPSFQYKKFYTSLLIYYQSINKQVINETYYIGDGLFLQQNNNIIKGVNTGGEVNFKINNVYGFGANVSLTFQYFSSKGLNWRHHLNAFKANFTLWWNKGPLIISYWRKIPGKYLIGFYEGKEENGNIISIEYKLNKHLTIGGGWWYIFEKKGTQYPLWSFSEVNPYYRERYIKNNKNMVVLSISFNTNFGTNYNSIKRTLNNSDIDSSLFKM